MNIHKRFIAKLIFVLPLAITVSAYRPVQLCSLEVVIKGAENADGNMSLLVYNSKNGFPSDASKACKSAVVKANGTYQRVVFDNLPVGTYAVAVMHDQNSNGVLDTNLLGIPQEGIGVSNNALNTFGPPIFEESCFNLNEPKKVIEITLDYW
jgi:uncharacterized protein (DUF2141 family)